MTTLSYIFLALQAISGVFIIALVLMQQGKGADTGAALGAGASTSLTGAGGSANLLSRLTATFAIVFFASTLAVTYFSKNTRSLDPSLFQVEPAAIQEPLVDKAPEPEAAK